MLDIHNATTSQHNVHGLERVGSLAGGALMFSKGLRHGGLIGLLQMVVGALRWHAGSAGIARPRRGGSGIGRNITGCVRT